jgi:hypothetical protein
MFDRIPTLADVCSAIAEGHIPVAVDGSMYQVNAFELRRYLNRLRPLPTVSTASAHDSSPHADSHSWPLSGSTLCSFGH